MVEIRQASIGDEFIVEQLLLSKIVELAKADIVQWEKEEVRWDVLGKTYAIDDFYIGFLADEPIGCFCVVDYDPTYWCDDKPKTALYIHKIMVLNKAKGLGVADQFLDYFKNLGRIKNMNSVKLDVREHKQKLRQFYERNEFELVEIKDLGFGYLTALYEYKLKNEPKL